jgi:hypothetical protein
MQPNCSSLTVGIRVCLHGFRSSFIGRFVRSLTGGFMNELEVIFMASLAFGS